MTRPLPRYVDEHQAAEILGVAPGTLANWRSERVGLPYHRPGGMRGVRYRLDQLVEFAERITVTPSPDARRKRKTAKADPAGGGER